MTAASPVAIVLPPGEGFAPGTAGPAALLVHRLLQAGADGVVIGTPTTTPPLSGVRFVPAPPGLGLGRTRRYAAGVARVLHGLRPALIEVHDSPAVALHLRDRFPGPPVVLWLGRDPYDLPSARTARERTRLLSRLALVVTASDWLRRRVLDGATAPVRAPDVLHAGITLPTLPDRAREPAFLFTGGLRPDSGVDAFVAACGELLPHLPGWRAVVMEPEPAGPDTPFLRKLRFAASVAGVELAGQRPRAEILAALCRTAIAVVANRWDDPSGLTALEPMACGAALVCPPRGALQEVAGDAALYADPDKRGALGAAMQTLAVDDPLRTRLSRAGSARAEAFSPDHAVTALIALREAILAGVGPGRADRLYAAPSPTP